ENRCERKTTVVALGGGVIGDIAGFAAAVYRRGIPYIQVPTTLLAQVDSSIGGKTAINHALGKNMIGAFHQPKLVLADTLTLNSLPEREFSAGLAEVIKYGLIRDPEFFDWLENHVAKLVSRESTALAYAVLRSCENKVAIVAADERESGMRALLNLGHTFGHAIETGAGYGKWLHGEAVSAGTLLAARLSQRLGLIADSDTERIAGLYRRAGLPVAAPDFGAARYRQLMGVDKKVEGGKIRFVLLKKIGEAFITGDVPENQLAALLDGIAAHA
ncbi:MAG: 3-dehydroquinate synthase, partial [Burkholderiales bacterium]